MMPPYKRDPDAIMLANDIVFGPTVTLDASYLVVFDDGTLDLSGGEWVVGTAFPVRGTSDEPEV